MKLSLRTLICAAPAALFLLSCHLAAFAQEGNVVIYRTYDSTGSVLRPSVYVDGKQAARLPNGCYMSMRLASGKHSFESSMKKAVLQVEVRPNETVYFQMVIQPGMMRGLGRLILANPDDAKAALPNLRPLDANQTLPEAANTPSPQPQGPASDNPPAQTETEPGPPAQPASVVIKSTPPGADINVDGKFMGNTPSTILLDAGEHLVLVDKEGFKPWQRTMTVSPGGSLTIDATLTKP